MTQALPGGTVTADQMNGNGQPPGSMTTTPQQQGKIDQDARDAAAKAAAAQARQDYLNHFNYGGVAGGANAASAYFNQGAQDAQNRQGEQINYGLAQGAYGQSQANAGYQGQLAQMMLARANGQMPSIAQMQADRQMQQATAAQMSAQASARGPAGLALAQQQAAGNIAGLQSNISNSAQINGANEQLQNQNAAFGAFSGMRGQDLQGMQAQADMAQKQAAINAAQRAQNDQYSMGQYGLANQIQTSQLGAQGNQIAIESGAQTAANNLGLQSQIHSDDQVAKYLGLGLGAAGTAAGVLGMLGVFGGSSKPISGTTSVNYGQGGGGNDGDYSDSGTGGNSIGNSAGSGSDGSPFPPEVSDVTAKKNISPLAYGMNGPSFEIPMQRDPATERQKADAFDKIQQAQAAQFQGLMSQGPAVGDPVTQQFAQGLAPSSYEYRDGIPGATPGMKVGPMAQNMAGNPVTGTAVRRDPNSGLLAIDGRDGLKVALGGVGHLAQGQQGIDARVAQLEAQLGAQRQGLMAGGPAAMRVAPGSAANGYNTELTPGTEAAYQAWLKKVAPGDDGRDYDYRGAYAAGVGRGGANQHFTDQFKKPNHETFSNESQYGLDRPEIAGSWDGDSYQPKGPPAWLRMQMESEAQGVQPSYAQGPSVGDQYLAYTRGQ